MAVALAMGRSRPRVVGCEACEEPTALPPRPQEQEPSKEKKHAVGGNPGDQSGRQACVVDGMARPGRGLNLGCRHTDTYDPAEAGQSDAAGTEVEGKGDPVAAGRENLVVQVPGIVDIRVGHEGVELSGETQHRWAAPAAAEVPGEVRLHQHVAGVVKGDGEHLAAVLLQRDARLTEAGRRRGRPGDVDHDRHDHLRRGEQAHPPLMELAGTVAVGVGVCATRPVT